MSTERTMWINHLDLLPGDPSVTTSFNAINSGVGSGLSGLIIQSNTVGEIAPGGGNKVVETALEIPPKFEVRVFESVMSYQATLVILARSDLHKYRIHLAAQLFF